MERVHDDKVLMESAESMIYAIKWCFDAELEKIDDIRIYRNGDFLTVTFTIDNEREGMTWKAY